MHLPLVNLLLAVGALALGTALPASGTELPAAAKPAPATNADAKAAAADHSPDEAGSYSVGLSFANQWRDSGLFPRMSADQLLRGIRAGLAGTPISADDRARAGEFMKTAYNALAARNQAKAVEFLARNAREPGVHATASGLQYQVLTAGDAAGRPAGPRDRITVKYRGRFIDGTEFDSTEARGRPAVIQTAMVMQGWREALASMTTGAKWRLFIPPGLAYGTTPPPSIPPNSLLIFEVELVRIEPLAAIPKSAVR